MSVSSSWWKAFPQRMRAPPSGSHFYRLFNDSEEYKNFLQGHNGVLEAEMLPITKESISKK
jgi:hypothetical protein